MALPTALPSGGLSSDELTLILPLLLRSQRLLVADFKYLLNYSIQGQSFANLTTSNIGVNGYLLQTFQNVSPRLEAWQRSASCPL